jgi:hypothetical protein
MSAFRREGEELALLGVHLLTGARHLRRSRVCEQHLTDRRGRAPLLTAMRDLVRAGQQVDVVTACHVLQRDGVDHCGTFIADCVIAAVEGEVVDLAPLERAILDARRRGWIDSLLHGLQVALRDPACDLDREVGKLVASLRRLSRATA